MAYSEIKEQTKNIFVGLGMYITWRLYAFCHMYQEFGDRNEELIKSNNISKGASGALKGVF